MRMFRWFPLAFLSWSRATRTKPFPMMPMIPITMTGIIPVIGCLAEGTDVPVTRSSEMVETSMVKSDAIQCPNTDCHVFIYSLIKLLTYLLFSQGQLPVAPFRTTTFTAIYNDNKLITMDSPQAMFFYYILWISCPWDEICCDSILGIIGIGDVEQEASLALLNQLLLHCQWSHELHSFCRPPDLFYLGLTDCS